MLPSLPHDPSALVCLAAWQVWRPDQALLCMPNSDGGQSSKRVAAVYCATVDTGFERGTFSKTGERGRGRNLMWKGRMEQTRWWRGWEHPRELGDAHWRTWTRASAKLVREGWSTSKRVACWCCAQGTCNDSSFNWCSLHSACTQGSQGSRGPRGSQGKWEDSAFAAHGYGKHGMARVQPAAHTKPHVDDTACKYHLGTAHVSAGGAWGCAAWAHTCGVGGGCIPLLKVQT